jgi:hypothetical protein
MRDAEMDRAIIPGARFANRATPAAVSPRGITKMTRTDFGCSSLLSYGIVSPLNSSQSPGNQLANGVE